MAKVKAAKRARRAKAPQASPETRHVDQRNPSEHPSSAAAKAIPESTRDALRKIAWPEQAEGTARRAELPIDPNSPTPLLDLLVGPPQGSPPSAVYNNDLIGNHIDDPTAEMRLDDLVLAIWGEHFVRDTSKKRLLSDWMRDGLLPANRMKRGRYVVSQSALSGLGKTERAKQKSARMDRDTCNRSSNQSVHSELDSPKRNGNGTRTEPERNF
jgi:hypothetical protein